MKTKTMMMSAMVLLAGFGLAMAADVAKPADKAATKAVVKQTLCPIMNVQINTNVFADVNGKRVYFCCASCKEEFLKTPEKFIAKMEKDGITLDKVPAADTSKK